MASSDKGRRKRSDLVLVAGDNAQMRKRSRRGWTRKQETEFLAALAATCNVTRAAEQAGVSASQAYRRRKASAAFRASWLDALGTAYHNLELVLLDRALNGTEKIVVKGDGREERMREYPNQLALTLLRMHRESAAEAETELEPEDVGAIRERLLAKLERVREREEARGSSLGASPAA